MTIQAETRARWPFGPLPSNVELGPGSIITGDQCTKEQVFRKFRSRLEPAIVIGAGSRIDGVSFNMGERSRVIIGDHCHFEEAYLLCEHELRIGNRVFIGWHATIVDSDFHPLAPAERLLDATACSPASAGVQRPPLAGRPVVVENDVWIGPNATILKGTRIGAGAFIEPGAVVVHDVPPRTRVLGNPAVVIGEL